MGNLGLMFPFYGSCTYKRDGYASVCEKVNYRKILGDNYNDFFDEKGKIKKGTIKRDLHSVDNSIPGYENLLADINYNYLSELKLGTQALMTKYTKMSPAEDFDIGVADRILEKAKKRCKQAKNKGVNVRISEEANLQISIIEAMIIKNKPKAEETIISLVGGITKLENFNPMKNDPGNLNKRNYKCGDGSLDVAVIVFLINKYSDKD